MSARAPDTAASYGRNAGLLSVGIGISGLVTYLYFAIAFSALVEALNLVAARRRRRFRLKASGEIVDEMAVKS